MYFECKKLKLTNIPYILLDGKKLEYVDSHKVLGMILTCSGSDNPDISRLVRSLYCRGNMIVRKFSLCSWEVKRHLFLTYCTSMYCCQLWSDYGIGYLKKLKVAYNNIFRKLFKLPPRCSASEMFAWNNVPTFDALRRKNIFSMGQRMSHCANSIIQTIWQSDLQYTNELRSEWHSSIH